MIMVTGIKILIIYWNGYYHCF